MKTKPTIVKKQALLVSKEVRLGKFDRVSKDFIDQVDAEFDAYIRRLRSEVKTADPLIEPTQDMLTPEAKKAILEIANQKLAAHIQNRVKRHPSIGKTLKD